MSVHGLGHWVCCGKGASCGVVACYLGTMGQLHNLSATLDIRWPAHPKDIQNPVTLGELSEEV